MEPILCYIRENYFKEHNDLIKVLDSGDTDKQSKRTHLSVKVTIDNNNYYIPLRNNLGDAQTELRIPNSQYRCIKNDMDIIQREFETYLRGYIKSAKKKRNQKEPLYRESRLINYINLLID